MLKVNHLTKQFGGLTAMQNVSFEIVPNSITAIIGPNGAGKTTLFNMVTGIYAPTSGDILFGDSRINGYKPDQVSRKGIARTFQNIRLFANLTVIENVLVAMHQHLKGNLFTSIIGLPSIRQEERLAEVAAYQLLQYVGLSSFTNEVAANLSYGSQRKLEIARALAAKPQLLLLDEPAAGMNPKETKQLTDIISRIRSDFHVTIVLIEHDMKLVMGISEQIIVLDHGEKIAEGTPAEIRENQQVIAAYLGASAVH